MQKVKSQKRLGRAVSMLASAALIGVAASTAHGFSRRFGPLINNFKTVTQGALSGPTGGPEMGDQNPYGVAVVPRTIGNLTQGNILVSNFNNAGGPPPAGNLQGTGSSIVQYSPDVGTQSTFAEIDAKTLPGGCPGGVGLTTALVVLQSGWVIVGSLPTIDGTIKTVGAGCLIVLDSNGNPVETFSGGDVNGPWDMTVSDKGSTATLFFTNVLNGGVASQTPDTAVNAGTVVRMKLSIPPPGLGRPEIMETKIIGSGFPEENDSAALIIGPTGVGLSSGDGEGTSRGDDDGDILYVADTLNNRIARIDGASSRSSSMGIGHTVSMGGLLNQPLGLALTPDGDILTVNAMDGNIVETIPDGTQSASATIAPAGAGSLFGLAVMPGETGIYFVDDSENQLNLFH